MYLADCQGVSRLTIVFPNWELRFFKASSNCVLRIGRFDSRDRFFVMNLTKILALPAHTSVAAQILCGCYRESVTLPLAIDFL